MTWFLDLRATSVGGMLAADVTVHDEHMRYFDISDLASAARGLDVLVGVHGFNVNRQDGIDSLSQWAALLDIGGTTLFIGVLWPGDSSWMHGLDYPIEGNEAVKSGQMLGLTLDRNFTEAASLSFVSHSLGARLVLETIRLMSRSTRRLILMAGAIDDDCLVNEYQDAAGKTDGISLLASRGDDVLKWAFPLGNPLSMLITRGHPYWKGALGYVGPAIPYAANLHSGWQIPDAWQYGHGNYLRDNNLPPPPPLASLVSNFPSQDSPRPKDFVPPVWSAGFVAARFR